MNELGWFCRCRQKIIKRHLTRCLWPIARLYDEFSSRHKAGCRKKNIWWFPTQVVWHDSGSTLTKGAWGCQWPVWQFASFKGLKCSSVSPFILISAGELQIKERIHPLYRLSSFPVHLLKPIVKWNHVSLMSLFRVIAMAALARGPCWVKW